MRSKASVVLSAILSVVLAGCNALPSEGPRSSQIEKAYLEKNTAGFVLVNVNRSVADYLARHQARASATASARASRRAPN